MRKVRGSVGVKEDGAAGNVVGVPEDIAVEIYHGRTDAAGNIEAGEVVRRVSGPVTAGFHRVAWDLRHASPRPVLRGGDDERSGPLAVPGSYSVELSARVDGDQLSLAGPQAFRAASLLEGTLPAADRGALHAFQLDTARLQRAVLGSVRAADEAATPQIRNVGTLGGNLCHARPAADTGPPSYVLDAELVAGRVYADTPEAELERRLLTIARAARNAACPMLSRNSAPTPGAGASSITFW